MTARRAGVRPLADYQALFPGFETVIAEAYEEGDREPPRDSGTNPERIGPYQLVRELGRGGQGVVWLAEDTRLRRRVAIKVLSGYGAPPVAVLRRFRREAEAASRLDHPGICTVYESGVQDGVPYIAMRYVEGEPLATKIAAARDPETTTTWVSFPDEVAEPVTATEDESSAAPSDRAEIMAIVALIEKVARALGAAHEAGILHRDVKPGNIIVANDGQPVLLDFGLAQDTGGDVTTLTQTGDVFGTPAYMSPEQLTGKRISLGPQTDVYSLGVTLYECLTLKRPFDAPTREGLYQQILTKDPPDVRSLNAAIPDDLRVVVEAALEKDLDRRYRTAADFAEDLRRVREREPIHARPVTRWVRLVRWAQRNPAVAMLLVLLFVAIAGGAHGVADRARRRPHQPPFLHAHVGRAPRPRPAARGGARALARGLDEGRRDGGLAPPRSRRTVAPGGPRRDARGPARPRPPLLG